MIVPHGATRGLEAWTDDCNAKLRDLAASGLGAAGIADQLGRSTGAVRQQAHKLRLSLRQRDESGRALRRCGTVLGQPRGESWVADPRRAEYRRRILDDEADAETIEQAVAAQVAGMRRPRLCAECGRRPAATVHRRLCIECAERLRTANQDASNLSERDQLIRALERKRDYHEALFAEAERALTRLRGCS